MDAYKDGSTRKGRKTETKKREGELVRKTNKRKDKKIYEKTE